MKEPTLQELKKEIDSLKKQKERKMALATSMQERNKLRMEINKLDEMSKSPSQLKSFGKTFGRGLKIIGKNLWKGIKTASRNLDKNDPELRKFGRSMTRQPQSQMSPFSPVAQKLYMPESQSYYKTTPRKMKAPKMKKRKGKKMNKSKGMKKPKRRMIRKPMMQKQNQPMWGLP